MNAINVQNYIYTWLFSPLITTVLMDTPGRQKTRQQKKKVPDGFGRSGRDRIGRENTPFGRKNTFLGRSSLKSSNPPPQKTRQQKKRFRVIFQSLSQSSDGSEVGNTAFHSGGILKLLAPLTYLNTSSSSASDHRSPQGYSAYMVMRSVVLSTLGCKLI